MKRLLPFLALALLSCKRPPQSGTLTPTDTTLLNYNKGQPIVLPAKLKNSTIIFAQNSTVDAVVTGKNKAPQNRNEQTATGGSTVGASDQTGTSTSKAKNAAVSTAEAANTGGQGSKVEGNASAEATNTPKGGLPWWAWLGIGIALGWAGRRLLPF